MKKLILIITLVIFGFGCSERKVTSPTKKESVKTEKGKSKAIPSNASKQTKEYKITAVKLEGKKAEFQIIPNEGFKINVEFPWKFKFKNTEIKSGEGKHIQLDAKHANIAVELADTAGAQLEGVGDFSVCNDEKCLMYRAEKIIIKKQ